MLELEMRERIADLEIVITATMLIETELKVELAKISAAHSALEREKQMYINSTDRLTARIKELEAELAIAQAGPASKHPVRRTDSLRTNNEELFATWMEGE